MLGTVYFSLESESCCAETVISQGRDTFSAYKDVFLTGTASGLTYSAYSQHGHLSNYADLENVI